MKYWRIFKFIRTAKAQVVAQGRTLTFNSKANKSGVLVRVYDVQAAREAEYHINVYNPRCAFSIAKDKYLNDYTK